MFDFSNFSESLKSSLPPPSYLSFTFNEIQVLLNLLDGSLESFDPSCDDKIYYENVKNLFEKLINYQFH